MNKGVTLRGLYGFSDQVIAVDTDLCERWIDSTQACQHCLALAVAYSGGVRHTALCGNTLCIHAQNSSESPHKGLWNLFLGLPDMHSKQLTSEQILRSYFVHCH